ncbi:hypothetical protein [Devosia aurantiaca]|jgi:hypothetical protein|uniref:Uncharacterized protein n=1 Tax=Devosia aurantiaca TaxID=2714858 RepID=A0A6M1SLE2_9HYPH|nr:hypothetical protein [Devosia aurantiaca]NGP17998.1 hypothetical protein [Devosia aurantiaca]
MKPHVTPIERAFELARSGQCRSTTEIKKALKSEGYVIETLTGATLLKQLRNTILAHGGGEAMHTPRS